MSVVRLILRNSVFSVCAGSDVMVAADVQKIYTEERRRIQEGLLRHMDSRGESVFSHLSLVDIVPLLNGGACECTLTGKDRTCSDGKERGGDTEGRRESVGVCGHKWKMEEVLNLKVHGLDR